MTNEPEKTANVPINLDQEDMWVRGKAYVRHKQLLEQAEMRLVEMKRKTASAEYEHAITRRILEKTSDPETRENWDVKATVAQDIAAMTAEELEEATASVAYHRAMVAEMEADLGEKAEPYESILAWEDEEDWDDEEDFDDFDGFADMDLDEGFCPYADVCPILNEELGLILDEEEDEEGEEEMPEVA